MTPSREIATTTLLEPYKVCESKLSGGLFCFPRDTKLTIASASEFIASLCGGCLGLFNAL